MRALAQFIVRGPVQAVTAVAGFALAAFLLPPMMWLSGGALALVTLTHGARAGTQVLIAVTVVTAALGLALFRNAWFGPVLAAADWLPVWLCALALGATGSLAVATAAGAAIAAGAVLAAHGLVQDLPGLWRQALDSLLAGPVQEMGLTEAEKEAVSAALAKVATGILAASGFVSTMLSLWIGRAWQALLYNPGGFGREFRGLRLGRGMAILTALVTAGAGLWSQPLWIELALILLVAFAFEGLGFVHWLAHRSGRPTPWLVGFYVVLGLMLPQALPVVAGLGVVDGLLDLRRRIAGGGRTD